MKTIEAEVTVGDDGQIEVQVSRTSSVPSGKYRAILVIEEASPALVSPKPLPPLTIISSAWVGSDPNVTYSREDISRS